LSHYLLLLTLSLFLTLAGWRAKLRPALGNSGQKRRLRIANTLWVIGAALGVWTIGSTVNGFLELAYVDSAIGTLRNIAGSEDGFANGHPQRGFTCDFADFTSDKVLLALAKDNVRNGYKFQIRGCEWAKPNRRYQAVAVPLRVRMESFCIDESGVLKIDEAGSADGCLRGGIPFQ
jgi:hypothetical protein